MSSVKSSVNVNTMPTDKKTAKKPAAAESAAPAPAPAPAPSAAKPARKSAKAEVTLPVTPAVTTVAAVTTDAPAAEVRSADALLSALQDHLKALTADLTARVRDAGRQALEVAKAVKREARDSKKRRRKNPEDMTPEERKVWEARRANNAFLKLRPISDELAVFMGLPAKSQASQTTVTKFISTYVKAHNCFDPNFKRRIIPDQKLGKILRVKDGQEVTYLNLQSYLKVHFLKPVVPV